MSFRLLLWVVPTKALPRVLGQHSVYGTETEVTPGGRIISNLPKGLEYVVEGAIQRGSYSNEYIHSGAVYGKAGYNAKSLPWHPRLLAEYDYATGNTHHDVTRVSTFDQLYPSNHNVFGLVDLFGWQNIEQSRINLDLTPASHLTVLVQEGALKVATTHDSVYSSGGTAAVKLLEVDF
jgi:Alginate export